MATDEQSKGNTGDPHLRVVEGGREALERQYLWAIMSGHPDREALGRRLDRPANASLEVVEPNDPKNFAAVTIARNGG